MDQNDEVLAEGERRHDPNPNPELARYIEERAQRRDIVATTRTPSGQVIDWVPVESQVPGRQIATPPPAPRDEPQRGPRPDRLPEGVRQEAAAEFELQGQGIDLGPEGTVPIVRLDSSRIPTGTSLDEGIARLRGRKAPPPTESVATRQRPGAGSRSQEASKDPAADPTPFGYFHAQTTEDVICFGGETVLNIWDPWVENAADHSLSQMGIVNRRDQSKLQSIEVGWQISRDRYGDWDPHLFVYYTTNGYTDNDDNIGGYNQDVDGWKQVSRSIVPQGRLVPASERAGTQAIVKIKIQLFEANWWVQVQNEWIGYYPASLFMGKRSIFGTLGDHGDWIGFWGEVFSANDDPNTTTTKMGSGSFGEAGWGQACYQHNLMVQGDRGGTLVHSAGSTTAENPAWYDIVQTITSDTAWGSFFFAGGPGNDIRWASLGGQWPGDAAVAQNADGRLEVFLRGNDTNLYHRWQTAPNNGWSAPWAPMGGQWHRDPVVARNADGRLEVFIIGDDTNLYHRWQTSPGGRWSEPWTPMGGQWHHQPVLGNSADGRLEVFIIGDDTDLYHLWQTAPNNGWSAPWAPMGGQWHHDPVVARNADGRLEVFIIGDDTDLYHLWQTAPNNGWSAPWAPMGGQWHHQPVLGNNADGRLEIFIIGDDTDLYHLWQTAPNNGWSAPWAPLGGQWPADPTVTRNADGRLEIFVHGNWPYLYHRWQTAPNNGWSADWAAMRGSWHRPAVIGHNQDGRLEIFIIGDDTDLYHAWQTAPNNGWALS